jgi:HK97 family phage portal protein
MAQTAASRSQILYLTDPVPPSGPLPASRDEALGLPTFGSGVDLLASTVADVPIDAFRWDAARGVDVRLADQPTILTDPDPRTTAWGWRYACTKDLIEAGNHVALLGDDDWRTGRPGWLIPLPVADVGLLTDPADPGWYMFTVAGVTIDPADVLHISAGNRSGEILGQGVISQYAQALGQQVAAEEWSARYLDGGGLPPAVIQVGGTPTQAQADDFKSRWNALTTKGEAIILPSGATVTPLQSDAQAQQLVEARTFGAEAQARILRIPPHMLGLNGPTMTYQNVQSAEVAYTRDVVTRWSNPINYALTKWLLPAGTEARSRWSARGRTDRATQATTEATLVQAGIQTVDEARQNLGMEPMESSVQEGTTPVGVPNLGAQEAVA